MEVFFPPLGFSFEEWRFGAQVLYVPKWCKIYHVTCSKRKHLTFAANFQCFRMLIIIFVLYLGGKKIKLADMKCQFLMFYRSASNNLHAYELHVIFFSISFRNRKMKILQIGYNDKFPP